MLLAFLAWSIVPASEILLTTLFLQALPSLLFPFKCVLLFPHPTVNRVSSGSAQAASNSP